MSNNIRDFAANDRRCNKEFGSDLNPFSTPGARNLWQQGWAGVRPANLVDGSGNWRMWERGRQALLLAREAS